MPDGTNTPRQLSDLSGEITLSARYTPWGDTLDTYGTGNFTYGYFGGVLDTTTGLLYVGNGQYYDPETGRFITRDAKSDNSNPYVPWDPTGAIVGPLAAMALFFGKRRTRSKWEILIILISLGITTGIGVIACTPAPTTPAAGSNTPPPIPVSTQTPVPVGAGTSASNTTGTPAPSTTPTLPDCPTATLPSTPLSVSNFIDVLLSLYGVELQNSSTNTLGTWNQRLAFNAWRAVTDIANRFGGPSRFRQVFRTLDQNLVLMKVGSYIEYLSGTVQVTHYNGAITKDTHLVEIADIEYQVEDSIRNNVVHELGHVFDNNHGNPSNTMPDNFKRVRNQFMFQPGDDGIMWQLHPPAEGSESNNSETFADMFIAHTYTNWLEPNDVVPDPRQWMEDTMRTLTS